MGALGRGGAMPKTSSPDEEEFECKTPDAGDDSASGPGVPDRRPGKLSFSSSELRWGVRLGR